ncbi:MAG: hypothetical protein KJO06_03565 [Gemmatimonadetes bacterium]|nr:hypothetical protein [Gemmatimonadota bacterium]NNK48617.1 hypothetical protein [Gemmatimonadota bacterium]
MTRQRRYVLIALILQLAMVLTSQASSAVANLSGLFGMGIPLVVGWFYAVRRGLSLKEASTGGVLIGAVGAAIGLVVAIALGGGSWSLLPLGTAASTFTGWLGAFLGWTVKGGRKTGAEG